MEILEDHIGNIFNLKNFLIITSIRKHRDEFEFDVWFDDDLRAKFYGYQTEDLALAERHEIIYKIKKI